MALDWSRTLWVSRNNAVKAITRLGRKILLVNPFAQLSNVPTPSTISYFFDAGFN